CDCDSSSMGVTWRVDQRVRRNSGMMALAVVTMTEMPPTTATAITVQAIGRMSCNRLLSRSRYVGRFVPSSFSGSSDQMTDPCCARHRFARVARRQSRVAHNAVAKPAHHERLKETVQLTCHVPKDR